MRTLLNTVDHYFNIFSEVGQPKGYRVVKFNHKNDIQDYFVPIEPMRKLEIVTAIMKTLYRKRQTYQIRIIISISN